MPYPVAPWWLAPVLVCCGGPVATAPVVTAPEERPPDVPVSEPTTCGLPGAASSEQGGLVELPVRLPLPDADDRVEVFDPQGGRLYSFLGHIDPASSQGTPPGQLFSRAVWSAALDGDCLGAFRREASLPDDLAFGSYWGRATVSGDGGFLYFTGPFGSHASYVAALGTNGAVEQWTATTAIPPSPTGRRSLHQTFAHAGRIFVLGGWHQDGQPALDGIASAPVLEGGGLGEFAPAQVSLPAPLLAFSVARCGRSLYVARDSRLVVTTLDDRGGPGPFVLALEDPEIHHESYGNNGLACVGSSLALVDEDRTHLFSVGDDGSLSLVRRIEHPRPFSRRSVHALADRVLVTTTDEGRIYSLAP